MKPAPIRFGILGTGSILAKYARAARLARGLELVAVASRDPERARSAAAIHQLPRAHGAYQALLADNGVDAVINALPNGLHCEWTCRALQAGKHVLCEKPLACSSSEADQMFAAAARHQRWLMEGYMYRFHPQLPALRARLPELGRLLHVHSRRMSQGREAGNPRYDPANGGGALMDIGCYCVDFSLLILGAEPVQVSAAAHLGPTGVDLTLTGSLAFPDHSTAQFCCSFESAPSYSAEIVGTEGCLLVPHPWMPPVWPTSFELVRGSQTETVIVQPESVPADVLAPFALELEHFADCIRQQHPPTVMTEAESRANLRVIEQLRAAALAARL